MLKNLILTILGAMALEAFAEQKHTTIVVSLDGCRWDYPLWYDTPTLDYIAEHGLEGGLIPSFPSKTFPNHYTLATGLYPDHHGIVANRFLNGLTGEVWSLGGRHSGVTAQDCGIWKGEPIWLTAKRQGLRASVFYWPGSDVAIMGEYPDRYYDYDVQPRLSLEERVEGILSELSKPEGERPELIMAYMEQPDANGHKYGPQSKETRKAMMYVDSLIGVLYKGICNYKLAEKTNLIVVSDHGMAWVDSTHAIKIRPYLKECWVRDIEGEIPACVYANEGCADSIYNALKDVDHARVWRKAEVPAYLNYGTSPHIGDVVVLPDIGYVIYEDPIVAGGSHGYDPTLEEMHAIFRAIGPDIPNVKLQHLPNVCVYNLLCRLLGIEPASNDGYDPLANIEN